MKIKFHPSFKKSYKARIAHDAKLVAKVQKRLFLFQENPQSPLLKDHLLTGSKRNFRAFSITGDIRIVYLKIPDKHIILLDIGSHNQVY